MNRLDFLRRVLPPQGHYYSVRITPGKSPYAVKCDSLEDLDASLASIKTGHAYFTTASTDGNGRKKANLLAKRGWYVDVDCTQYPDKPPPQYQSKAEGHAAIVAALRAGLPPFTFLLDSGGGFQLWWDGDTDVVPSQWRPYAQAVERACEHFGLKIDGGITIDSARIMRAPETLNWKTDPPVPTRLLYSSPRPYALSALTAAFSPFLQGPAATLSPSPTPSPDGDWSDLTGGMQETHRPPPPAEKVLRRCPLMTHSLNTNGKDDAGLVWHKILNILSFTQDGRDWIHPVSSAHPEYDPDVVERRYQIALDDKNNGSTGPTKCETFAAHSPVCQSCKFLASKSTPLMLGYDAEEELPQGWRVRNGVTEQYDPDQEEYVFALPYEFLSLQAAHSNNGLLLRMLVRDEQLDFTSEALKDAKVFSQALLKRAWSLTDKQSNKARFLVQTWLTQLQVRRQVGTVTDHLGWDGNRFVLADHVMDKSGENQSKFRSDDYIADTYRPVGTVEEWSKRANHLLQQHRPTAWAMLAASFGAPLVRFTGVKGAILSVVSEESGTGKTTALEVAQTVWGSSAGVAYMDDTENSVANRLGMLRNLPGFWDEVRQRDQVRRFTKLLFRLSGGKEKQRLTSSVQQRRAGNWETILVVASNESLIDHVAEVAGNTDAGAARVLELIATPFADNKMSPTEGRHFYAALARNYGQAGVIYSRYLATQTESVEKIVRAYDQWVSSKVSGAPALRFRIALVASMLAGATIANKLGLCQFDVAKLAEYLIASINAAEAADKETFKVGPDRAVEVLAEFMRARQTSVVISERLPAPGTQNAAMPCLNYRAPAAYRIATKDRRLLISISELREWLEANPNYGQPRALIRALTSAGAVRTRKTLEAGLAQTHGTKQYVLDINLLNTNFSALDSDHSFDPATPDS